MQVLVWLLCSSVVEVLYHNWPCGHLLHHPDSSFIILVKYLFWFIWSPWRIIHHQTIKQILSIILIPWNVLVEESGTITSWNPIVIPERLLPFPCITFKENYLHSNLLDDSRLNYVSEVWFTFTYAVLTISHQSIYICRWCLQVLSSQEQHSLVPQSSISSLL